MSTLREFFTTEATDVLGALTKLVQRLDGGSADHAALQRHTRELRGSAQMAREDRVYRAAVGLESAARALAARSKTSMPSYRVPSRTTPPTAESAARSTDGRSWASRCPTRALHPRSRAAR